MTEKDLKLIQQQAEKEEKHEKNKKMEIAPSDNLTLQSVNSLVVSNSVN